MKAKARKLHIIEKILKEESESVLTKIETILKKKPSDKNPSDYAGCISKTKARELLQHIENSRKEWERDI